MKQMVGKLMNHKSKTVLSAAFILAITALLSRVLGLLRDRLLAGRFGAGDELDIYFTAFRLPDLIYSILIMGAISSALIPVFAQYFKKDEKSAWQLIGGLISWCILILIVLSGILILFAPQVVAFIAPGFSDAKKDTTVALTRIMFLSPLLLGISSILSGVLQYFRRFFIYSLAPIVYNLGIILGIIFFVPKIGLIGLAWGVALGAFLHFLIQLPSAIYSGFKFDGMFKSHVGIKKIFKLTIPRTIGLAGSQINYVVITAIASGLTVGSIAIFNLANNLQHVPIGIIGISFSLAVFPRLAESSVEENKEKFSQDFSSVFNQILYLVLPITVIFFILRAQIIRLLLGTGQFGWADTRLTAAALGIFAISVFAQSLIPLISRAFYSLHDTKTPVSISLISIGLNIVMSLGFVWILSRHNIFSDFFSSIFKLQGIENFAVLGLPLALSLSSIFNFAALMRFFNKKVKEYNVKSILKSISKIIISCVLMGGIVYGLLQIFNLFFDTKTFIGLFLQTGISGLVGVGIYFIISLWFKLPESMAVAKKFLFRNKKDKLEEVQPPELIK
jgi:putative peptidoglycan lipid II flippase